MKLADWMHAHRVTPEQLRRKLGLASRTTIARYLSGDRTPHPTYLARIAELTGGRVTEADFTDPDPPTCAAIVTDQRGRRRLIYPWNTRADLAELALKAANDMPPEGEPVPEPIARALAVLGDRASPARRGQYLLDGRRCDARGVIAAANALLAAREEPLIHYPGVRRRDP